MRISKRIYLVASGLLGCSLSHDNDCNVYALDGGDEFALIDSGCGIATERLVENLARDGIAPDRVRLLLLTHGHLDHSGGTRYLHDHFKLEAAASQGTADALEAGDEEVISLGAAKRAGLYPADVRFDACPVARVLREGDELRFGECIIQVLETPGHSRDMINFLVLHDGQRSLFSGDTVFHGGRIQTQDIAGCDVPSYARTLRRLAGLQIDGLYPGHSVWSESRGQYHLEKAREFLDRLLLPPNLV